MVPVTQGRALGRVTRNDRDQARILLGVFERRKNGHLRDIARSDDRVSNLWM
jgi:hypothetical protein